MIALSASAQEAAPPPSALRPISDFPWYVGLSGGPAYATLNHPQIAAHAGFAAGENVSFLTPTLSLHAGYTIGERLGIGIEFSTVETGIARHNPGETFNIGATPQRGCNNCQPKAGAGQIIATQLVFGTFGPRIDYALLGRDGLFISATAGVASLVGLTDKQGFGATGRIGYRVRASNVMTVSLEAGFTGQTYGDTTIYLPFGAAVLRPYF
ncbi:MAG: hypothetical protein U0441_22005 [Polyangiaceae bacterium]